MNSIHPFSSAYSVVGSRGQQTQQADPGFPLTRNMFQLILGDPEAFTGQPGDIIPPVGPGSSPGSPPVGRAWKTSRLSRQQINYVVSLWIKLPMIVITYSNMKIMNTLIPH